MKWTFFAALSIMCFYHFLAPKSETVTTEEDTIENTNEYCHSIDESGMTIQSRYPAPSGYSRVSTDSYATYLRNLPLKKYGEKVKYYDGRVKENNYVYCSVIDMEIDPVDLQQCADAVMRIRGEYLFSEKRYSDIHFNFVSDGKAHYCVDYANGDLSYKKFRKYMKHVFNRANTRSLRNELKKVENKNQIQAGDVFVVAGNPFGHAILVLDVVENAEGEKQFLLGQSYMPAQETQVLLNPQCTENSPWFNLKPSTLETPEWNFEWSALKRFPVNRP